MFTDPKSTFSERHISDPRGLPPQIFTRGIEWLRLANPRLIGDDGPPTISNNEDLKIWIRIQRITLNNFGTKIFPRNVHAATLIVNISGTD